MSLENAFETGRLYKPLRDIADAQTASEVFGSFMLLPGIRSFWPMSATNGLGHALDLVAGDGVRLFSSGTPVHGALATGGPYAQFSGSDYYYRSDIWLHDVAGTEADIDPAIRGLTVGGWFQHDSLSFEQAYIAKFGVSGNYSYLLSKTNASEPRIWISNNGSAVTGPSGTTLELSKWYFLVGRFRVGLGVDLFQDDVQHTSSTGWTSIYNSTAELRIGAAGESPANRYLQGRASLCFLCASALSDDQINNLYQVSRSLFGV